MRNALLFDIYILYTLFTSYSLVCWRVLLLIFYASCLLCTNAISMSGKNWHSFKYVSTVTCECVKDKIRIDNRKNRTRFWLDFILYAQFNMYEWKCRKFDNFSTHWHKKNERERRRMKYRMFDFNFFYFFYMILTCYTDDDFNRVLFFSVQLLSQPNQSCITIYTKNGTGNAITNVTTIWISS